MNKWSLTPWDMSSLEGKYGQVIENGPCARVKNGICQEWVPGYGWYWCRWIEDDMLDPIYFRFKSKEFIQSQIEKVENAFSKKLMGQFELAVQIATECHKGQKDKAGVDYIHHPLKVSELCTHEISKCVAVLHDVMEDCGVTYNELLDNGVISEIVWRVCQLTHEKEDTYKDYIEKISLDPVAREVKIADLTHNMDIRRIPNPTEADFKRIEKYKKALDFLKSVNY